MHRSSLFTVTAAALLASACTHLDTTPDYSTDQFNQPVTGIPYALPALRYKLGITSRVASCSTLVQLGTQAFSDGNFALATKIVPTATYVPGERYLADYDALTSPFKTTSFTIENYPSGVLKSVNASAEDQSGPLIKDVVSIGLSIAGMAGGVGPIGLLGTAALTEGAGKAGIDAKIANLLKESPTGAIMCRSTTADDVANFAKAADAAEKAAASLESATKEVATWTTVNASRRANRDDLMALKKALDCQAAAQDVFDAAKEALDKAKAKVTLSAETWWPKSVVQSPTRAKDVTQPALPDERDVQVLADKLELRAIPIVTKDHFANWWGKLSPDQRGDFIAYYERVATHYGVSVASGFEVTLASDPIVCGEGSALIDCLARKLTVQGTLELLDRPPGAVKRPAIQQGGRLPGILIRTAQKANFTLCPIATPKCGRKEQIAYEAGVSAPQFGQLRLLPFKNRMFEAAALTLALREDGSLEKFAYNRTKAIAGEAAAALKDAIGQYEAFHEKQEKKATDAVAAARAEEIGGLDHQIAVLTKRAELLKLQNPQAPNAQQAIIDETAQINVEVALLNAKLAKLKAEAALASGGGAAAD